LQKQKSLPTSRTNCTYLQQLQRCPLLVVGALKKLMQNKNTNRGTGAALNASRLIPLWHPTDTGRRQGPLSLSATSPVFLTVCMVVCVGCLLGRAKTERERERSRATRSPPLVELHWWARVLPRPPPRARRRRVSGAHEGKTQRAAYQQYANNNCCCQLIPRLHADCTVVAVGF